MAAQGTDRVNQLLKAGQKAVKAGDKATASEKYRKAAEISPYDERVWLALLDVVTDPEDQRVCLENILQINPKNATARRRLQPLQPVQPVDPQLEAERRYARQEKARWARRRRWRSLRSGFGLGLLAGFVGALVGLMLSIVVYGLGFYAAEIDRVVAPLRGLIAP